MGKKLRKEDLPEIELVEQVQEPEGFQEDGPVRVGFIHYFFFGVLVVATGFVLWLYLNGVLSRDQIPPLPGV